MLTLAETAVDAPVQYVTLGVLILGVVGGVIAYGRKAGQSESSVETIKQQAEDSNRRLDKLEHIVTQLSEVQIKSVTEGATYKDQINLLWQEVKELRRMFLRDSCKYPQHGEEPR